MRTKKNRCAKFDEIFRPQVGMSIIMSMRRTQKTQLYSEEKV